MPFPSHCKHSSSRRTFGIYDPPPGSIPAFIVENSSYKWIAVVQNDYSVNHDFYAIDNCESFPLNVDGSRKKRCDGVLISEGKIAFVELKSVNEDGPNWVRNAVKQLISSILYYQEGMDDSIYDTRRAYVSNDIQPRSRSGQAERIERFANDTNGYALFIKQRINLFDVAG